MELAVWYGTEIAPSDPRSASASRCRGTSAGTTPPMATGTGQRLDDIAHELFQLVTQICLSTLRGRRRGGELKEIEFLTLSLLQTNGTMTVGEIQKLLCILPAQ